MCANIFILISSYYLFLSILVDVDFILFIEFVLGLEMCYFCLVFLED